MLGWLYSAVSHMNYRSHHQHLTVHAELHGSIYKANECCMYLSQAARGGIFIYLL
jgi:hypothetical protein